MPVCHYHICGACGRKKADINTIGCKTCNQEICNQCWIIGNPDPLVKDIMPEGKVMDPKANEILWCCPKCKNILLREPVGYMTDETVESLQ